MKKKYSTIEAVFHNTLISHLKSLDFNINSSDCSLHYLPDSPTFTPSISLNLRILSQRAVVDFSDLSFLSLHSDTKAIKNYANLPRELQQALAQYIFEDIMNKFAEIINTPITFLTEIDKEETTKAKENLYPFSFAFCVNSVQIPLVFHLPKICIEQIIPILTSLPTEKIDISNTLVPCTVEVGSMELSIQELRDLEEGDVLLVDSLSHLGQEKTALFYPLGMNEYNQLPAFLCTLEKNSLIFSQNYNLTQDISMSEELIDQDQAMQEDLQEEMIQENADAPVIQEETAQSQAKVTTNFADIKMKVSFELERRTMTIAELENLSVGSNLLLDSDPLQPVTLVVSDTAFAKARIVEIEGKYGLQLTEIFVK